MVNKNSLLIFILCVFACPVKSIIYFTGVPWRLNLNVKYTIPSICTLLFHSFHNHRGNADLKWIV
jgi:hypothetical protein